MRFRDYCYKSFLPAGAMMLVFVKADSDLIGDASTVELVYN